MKLATVGTDATVYICLVSGPDILYVNKSQTHAVPFAPAVTGSIFYAAIQILLDTVYFGDSVFCAQYIFWHSV